MAPPAKGGNVLTRRYGPLPAWAWAAIGVGVFLVYKQRKAAKAAAAGTTTTGGPVGAATTPIPPSFGGGAVSAPSGYGYVGPGAGGGGTGLIPTGAVGQTAGLTNYPAISPPGGGSGVAAAPAPNYGLGQITIGNQLYDILGQTGGAAPGGGFTYTGYNVGGGAPVFYGNATAGVEQGQAQGGQYVYTPAGNEALISAAPTTEVIR